MLDVLLRKHRTIRSSLGISVPVPGNTGSVVQALMQGLLLRGGSYKTSSGQMTFGDVSDDFAADIYRD